ncbi:hypothetical protein [Carboxylicivirga sp. M1479]|uniref:hypothetical protein n=1 Tax=Carboxylicivirga sp. M1479 TaxID=2594476 RepID=UPI0011788D2A|nr:hypothetical protein [Carboxylicivirga sp. M1479]TRX70776.1 hypothetical protein FNN09_09800 [Carboxylicivirga sp. M1479]
MRKLLFTWLFALICQFNYAQTDEISLTYSPASLYRFEKWVDGSHDGQTKYFILGAFNLDYYRYINTWLKIGVNLMYDKVISEGTGDLQYYTFPPTTSVIFDYRSTKSTFVIAPQVEFEYLRNPKFRLASGLSFGYGKERHKNNGGLNYSVDLEGFTYHINLLSFKWGNKHGLTGHIGAGHKGFVNLGYFVRF